MAPRNRKIQIPPPAAITKTERKKLTFFSSFSPQRRNEDIFGCFFESNNF